MTDQNVRVCPLARRRLLLGAGAAGLTALLAACGGDPRPVAGPGGTPVGFHAYEAQCPHDNVLVSLPNQAGVITCPGHLSHFRAADGSRIDGPAPRGLATLQIDVVDGYVVER